MASGSKLLLLVRTVLIHTQLIEMAVVAVVVSLFCGVTVEAVVHGEFDARCSRVCCGQRRLAQGSGVVEGRRPLVGGELACWLRLERLGALLDEHD